MKPIELVRERLRSVHVRVEPSCYVSCDDEDDDRCDRCPDCARARAEQIRAAGREAEVVRCNCDRHDVYTRCENCEVLLDPRRFTAFGLRHEAEHHCDLWAPDLDDLFLLGVYLDTVSESPDLLDEEPDLRALHQHLMFRLAWWYATGATR